jgi:protoporphyrinogen oxidase
MQKVTIIGAGMAGFGASHRLKTENVESAIYEKNFYHGGNAASFNYDSGFIFDTGPHISFTQVKRLQELFAESVNQEYEIIQARVNNYWQGHWIKHPAQCNLYGLPEKLVVDIIRDFVSKQDDVRRINNYADWLTASYGKTFAETFPMKYGLKFHTTSSDNMSIDWLGPRMYRPTLEELLHGALSPNTSDVHYVDYFRYPSHNGFVSYFNHFLNQTEIKQGYSVNSVDIRKKEIRFSNGALVPYNHLISSIPLPDLIPLIIGAPDDVKGAAQKLACTTCVLVNIGINREDISDAHWTYFYDEEIFFTRLSFPHMLSPHNVPLGTGSIQAEVYYSHKYRPLDRTPEDCIQPVVSDLEKCGLIHSDDRILFSNAMVMPYANVIFDLERAEALAIVHGYLDDIGIAYCGRYGDWDYIWTDQSFMSGEKAAQTILDSALY